MSSDSPVSTGYCYSDAQSGHHHGYLLPIICKTLDEVGLPVGEQRLFGLGCSNGSMAHALALAATGKMDAHFTACGITAISSSGR